MSSSFLYPGLLYLGKMTMISAFLCGYYWIFLRNASFHPYNRWYLLSSVVLSLTLPFLYLPLPMGWMGGEGNGGIFAVFSPGAPGNTDELAPVTIISSSHGFFYSFFHGWRGLSTAYGLVTGVFAFLLLRSLYSLARLTGKYASTRKEGVRFFQTDEPGTPFSFLNLLFWNKHLALDTEQGRFILRHELYHIRQKHTLDILLLAGVRSLFWCNPFFHLILRELKVVHEFLADRYALSTGVEPGESTGAEPGESAGAEPGEPFGVGRGEAAVGSGRYAYAEWLVWQSVCGEGPSGDPGRAIVHQGVAHSFFNTHLKRRIIMITQINRPRPRYISRVMALPLLFLLFCVVAGRSVAGRPLHSFGKPVVTDSGQMPVNDLVRHYLHQLRYPATALDQGREESIWFSVKIGEHNRLLQFRQYDAAPDPKDGRNSYKIVVTSLPARFPGSGGSGPALTEENKMAVFLKEAQRASEKISADRSRVFAPGEYFFTIVFRIEKPAGADSTLSFSIESRKPGKAVR